jgi:hypothetical protein
VKARKAIAPLIVALATSGVLAGTLAVPAASAAEPTLTVDPITVHGITTAKLTGTVTSDEEANGGAEGYWYFQYCEDASPGECTEASAWSNGPEAFSHTLPAGSTAVAVEETLTGLKASTEYSVRLAALPLNTFVEVHSEEAGYQSFTTDPAPVEPSAAVDPAGEVKYTSAQLQGSVDPEGGNEEAGGAYAPIHWALELERAGEPGVFDPVASGDITGSEAHSNTAIDVPASPAEVTSLTPGHTYHYRLAVTYAGQALQPAPEGEFTTLAVAKPTIANLAVSSLEAESAHFSAEVDPGGTDPAFETSWHFKCSPECPNLHGGTLAPTSQAQTVEEDAAGLQANTPYTLTLFASNAGGEEEATTTFETPAAPPLVQTSGAGHLGQTEATLDGRVNPRNSQTTYWFEWGSGDCAVSACQALPVAKDGDAGAGGGLVHVAQALSGLTPQATYHFRLVAQNAAGTTAGADQTFTTAGAAASGACPNEAIREEQHSTYLAECRAYEMVSPPDKNGGDIQGDLPGVQSSADGGGVAYVSHASFGDTLGSGPGGLTSYLSRRGANGWSTKGITPTPRADASQVYAEGTVLLGYSDDLNRVVVYGYDLPGAEQSGPQLPNLYLEDTSSRTLQLVSRPLAGLPVSPQERFQWAGPLTVPNSGGISSDSRHLAFKAGFPLLPDAPVGSVYSWDDGTLHLASILPDGAPANGAELALAGLGYRQSVSPDGSRVFFTAEGQLYMRVNHSTTVLISESENPAFSGASEGVILKQVTDDSRHVIFDTASPLVREDRDSGPDLYLYTDGPDPQHEKNLTLIPEGYPPGEETANVEVIGSRADGSQIYLWLNSTIRLTEGGTSAEVASNVAEVPEFKLENYAFAATASLPGAARVSPDGRYLSFYTDLTPTKNGTPVAETGGYRRQEFYLYDSVRDSLRCVSCPTSGAGTGDASIGGTVTDIAPRGVVLGLRPTFLADDGRTFFSTSEPLVPEDTNGLTDAYEFEPSNGRVALLSSGKGTYPASFSTASPNGLDAFILTRQRLVGSDSESLVDLYDVRLDGGFPEPQAAPSPCDGDGCQGFLAPPPEAAGPGTAAATGHNVHRHRRLCRKRRHRGRPGRKKGRCVTRKHDHRHANHNRRAGR